MISPELRAALLSAIRGGQPLVHAAKALGIPRSSLYAERKRDSDFARELEEARGAAAEPPPVGVDPQPRRIAPAEMPREAREHLREACRLIAEARNPKPTPQTREKRALDAWLAGKPWPDGRLDVDEIGKLSSRARDDYQRHLLLRAAERAANEQASE